MWAANNFMLAAYIGITSLTYIFKTTLYVYIFIIQTQTLNVNKQ